MRKDGGVVGVVCLVNAHVWDQIPMTSPPAVIRRTSLGRILEQWLEAGCFKDSVQPWWLGTMSV